MQSEIPTLDRIHRLELTARRGRGCVARRIRIDDASGATRGEKWEAPRRTDVRHGYFTFLRYLPGEREDLGWIEREFFARAERIVGLDPKRVYDDQWLCAAGQLFLVSSGTMRMCADVRGWLARATRRETVASHPYDLCTSLAATEAGSPVLEVDDALEFPALASPLDLTTNVSFAAFVNARAKEQLLPVLRATLEAFRRARGRR